MGLGPNNTSLLTKLGKKQAWEMPLAELEALVAADQLRRSVQRAMGRVMRAAKDEPRKRIMPTLESLGFAPSICQQLRLTGKTETELIRAIQAKGLL